MLSSFRLAIALLVATASYSSLAAHAADLPTPAAITATHALTTESAEVGLARYLTKMGIKVYGSETCPFTRLQRQLFGEAGFKQLNYIECSPTSQQGQLGLCRAIQLQQTPTWEINGRFYQGVRGLDQLARLSHYSGATNFSQARPIP